MLDLLYYGWPYLGLVIAAAVVVLLFREHHEGGRSRWTDPAWAFGWVGPVYLVHQFEEHGIDLLGRRYAFLGEICQTLGYVDDCVSRDGETDPGGDGQSDPRIVLNGCGLFCSNGTDTWGRPN